MPETVDKVDPKDIQENVKEAEAMKKAMDAALKMKADVMASLTPKLKALEKVEKEMESIVQEAYDRVRYHMDMKKEVEMGLAGRLKKGWEPDAQRRVKLFVGVVAKETKPRFEKVIKEYKEDVDAIKDALK